MNDYQSRLDADIRAMRRLFWMKIAGEITSAELEEQTDRITNKQLDIFPEEEVQHAV